MKIQKIICLLISASVIMSFAGCGQIDKEKEAAPQYYEVDYELKDPSQLDDWQINVLKEHDLPTEYSELEASQQTAIYRMGVMHRYLVDKYGIEFDYAGYVPRGAYQSEEFMAWSSEIPTRDDRYVVVVKQDKQKNDGTLTDNYIAVSAGDLYNQYISDYVKDYFKSDEVVVFSHEFTTIIDDIDDISLDNINKIGGMNVIFVSGKICDENRFETFCNDYNTWQNDRKSIVANRAILLNEDVDIKEITYENYPDYFQNEKKLKDMDIFKVVNNNE